MTRAIFLCASRAYLVDTPAVFCDVERRRRVVKAKKGRRN